MLVVSLTKIITHAPIRCYCLVSRVTGHVDLIGFHLSGYRVYQALVEGWFGDEKVHLGFTRYCRFPDGSVQSTSKIFCREPVPSETVEPSSMRHTKMYIPLPSSSSGLPHFWTTAYTDISRVTVRKQSMLWFFSGAFGNIAVMT